MSGSRRNRGEAGFTLIELLMAIVLSGILLGAISTGFIAAISGTQGAHERFIATHGAQALAAHFTSDVQSTMPRNSPTPVPDFSPSTPTGCATLPAADSTTNLARLQWTEKKLVSNVLTTTAFSASYRIQQSGTEWQLVRWFCPDATLAPTPQVVAHDLGLTDGVINGSTVLTSAKAAFTGADVGRTLLGTNIPAGTKIASVTNEKSVVMTAAATGSTSSLAFAFGPLATAGPIVAERKVNLEIYALNDITSASRRSYKVSAHMRTPDPAAPSPSFKVTLDPLAPGPYTAGSTVTATITATTDGTLTDPNYISDHTLAFLGPNAALSGQLPDYPPQPMTFSGGTWTGPIKFYRAESTDLFVSDGSVTGASDTFTVRPATSHHLTLAAPASTTGGAPFSLTVAAKDVYENTLTTGYTRNVSFTSTDPLATLPAAYSFTAADNGSHQFANVVLRSASPPDRTITATDTAGVMGTTAITVNGAAAGVLVSFELTAPTEITAGNSFPMTVTAKDAVGGTATNYTGTIQFTSSDTQAGLPPTYTFLATDLGTKTFNLVLKTAGNRTVTVTDSAASVSATKTIKVNPAAASKLVFTNCRANGGLATPGMCSSVAVGGDGKYMEGRVSLQDAYGNPVNATTTLRVNISRVGGSAQFSITNSPVTINVGTAESSNEFKVTHTSAGGSVTLSAQTADVPGLTAGSMTVGTT